MFPFFGVPLHFRKCMFIAEEMERKEWGYPLLSRCLPRQSVNRIQKSAGPWWNPRCSDTPDGIGWEGCRILWSYCRWSACRFRRSAVPGNARWNQSGWLPGRNIFLRRFHWGADVSETGSHWVLSEKHRHKVCLLQPLYASLLSNGSLQAARNKKYTLPYCWAGFFPDSRKQNDKSFYC